MSGIALALLAGALSTSGPAQVRNLSSVGSTFGGSRLVPGVQNGRTGWGTALVGDWNADGFDDMVIGAPGDAGTKAGRAYLLFGGESTGVVVNLESLGTRGLILEGAELGDEAGNSVAGGQDFNGDGIDDIVIGAPSADPFGRIEAGEVYVLFGTRSPPATIELGEVGTTVPGLRIVGRAVAARAGIAVDFAGDFNRDGFADVIVGAPRGSPLGITNAGEVYIVFGGPNVTGVFDVATATSGGLLFTGDVTNLALGTSVAGAGDTNGDGIDDILMGAPSLLFSNRPGRAYLVPGGQAVPVPAPVSLIGTTVQGVAFSGPAAEDFAGYDVAGAGDTNGDGFEDFLIGAPGATDEAGVAYLVLGRSSSLPAFNLGLLTQPPGFGVAYIGLESGDRAGELVSGAGDVNGDGLDDILISAPLRDFGFSIDVGQVFVILSSQTLPSPLDVPLLTVGSTTAGYSWRGQADSDQAGRGLGGRGRFNGDGVEDYAIGAPGAEVGGMRPGLAYLVLDTVALPASASASRMATPGDARPRSFPSVRARLDFSTGAQTSPPPIGTRETVTLFRSTPIGLPPEAIAVLPVHWRHVSASRASASGSMTVGFTLDELGTDDARLIRAFTAPAAEGPWAEAAIQRTDAIRRRVTVHGLDLSTGSALHVALGVTAGPALSASAEAAHLNGAPLPGGIDPSEADANLDGSVDAADVVDLVNRGF